MIKVTGAVALNLLRHAVAAKGKDHVYVNPDGKTAGQGEYSNPSCYYVHDVVDPEGDGFGMKAVPGCIVGNVMHKLGVGFTVMRNEENNTSDSLVDAVMVSRHERDEDGEQKFEFTDTAKRVLRSAQSKQDGGATWGEALEYAEEMYVSYKTGPGLSSKERIALTNLGVRFDRF
ncbi:hypothetical protein SEA_IMMANUEL3_76 [Streptomyces phage Immanuel3]|uniref:Uncharacterized protein n=1 Tax=Streptomyces phage Immanuel3 TaxID=2053813 RepID=A0A2H4PR70_9CAUD|nr:hypothetical protein HWB41_gp22 [Streptomyces phage Immanuel3]ATW69427.1 hypothetical protein SEA_IMMANUEL3_76 [Streptomyces phage Immanuel3]